MQWGWYSPFRRINSHTSPVWAVWLHMHIPAALLCRCRDLAASPASGPGASASASAGARALRGAAAARGSPRSSRAERKCKRMVQSVLFGGWSTHVSYLPFSADGLHRPLHMSPTCPFRPMVCTGHYTCLLFVLFGGWSAQAFTHVSYVSFSADGLHRPLHVSYLSFWRMVCTGHYTNGADTAPCTLHCLRPDSIPHTLSCPCETSTLNLFGHISGPCHQKGERLHTGTVQEHNGYPCLPLA